MALNACELEIDLFCNGIRVPGDVRLDGSRSISRTRAGLGSGLELTIPTGSALKPRIWVNVPVEERFARTSPYVLAGSPEQGYRVRDDRDGSSYRVDLPGEPAWYSRSTSRGIPMNRIGVLQGTYLGIYVNMVCTFWNYSPSLNCRFCTTGQNVGEHEIVDKSVADVVEVARAAKAESGVTFVHLNAGFQGTRGVQFAEPYIRALKEEVGVMVGAQLAPEKDFSHYDRLIALGVDHVSFCLEFVDPEWFARICPGKERVLGQQLFFDSIQYCAARMPRGAVSGEIIAGVEPIDKTLEGIDWIASQGAFPTVCIFRPTVGADMEDWPSPRYEDMRRVMAHMYDACRRHWIPIGAAPNIEVSIVVNPDDAALIAPRNAGFYVYEAYRRTARVAARPVFARRMRPTRRRDPGADGENPQDTRGDTGGERRNQA
ncbi:MAG TPA: radical SAM protein [Vicinamibacterales bacterium]|nr:radical SAM protein [Vicinamibacterales bacterium]